VPDFARNVMRMLSARMRASNDLMVERLRERLQLEHLQKELRIARSIQASMLPARGALDAGHPAVELHGLMDPAEDIGGDLYDAFMPDSSRLVLALGDVSGKGIPAALFMARVIAALRAEAMRLRRPDALVARMNALLCQHNEAGMFVSLLMAVLEVDTGVLTYANAGHLPLAAAKAGGRFGWLPLPKGMVAGMVEGMRYTQERVQLEPGQRVLLYSDGVTEAADPQGDLYGDDRLLAALDASGASAAEAVTALRADVDAFARGARQSDDVTLLALLWRGPQAT
jgi:sigma-B regulation protein RsbU (phosphoserine phosphatase)